MKKQILFRGFNEKNNKWLYGYYFVNRGQHFVVDDEIQTNPLVNWTDFVVNTDTIGQYTGLTDKNGNKIFEGDIVEYYELESYCINPDCDGHLRGYGSSLRQKDGVVKFHNGEFVVDDGSAYLTGLSICGIYEEMLNDLKENTYFEANGYDIDNSIVGKKIIGNVTDNPELIE